MGRQGLMDDSGYHGFDECSCYEECTNNIIEHLLEPYGAESIEELITKTKADLVKDQVYNEALLDYYNEIDKTITEFELLKGGVTYDTVNDLISEVYERLKR